MYSPIGDIAISTPTKKRVKPIMIHIVPKTKAVRIVELKGTKRSESTRQTKI